MQIPTVSVADLPDPIPDGMSVLDVREPLEWQHGHIEGSVHIPLMQLPTRLDEVPLGHVLVVCRIGGRSAQAVGYLLQQGHEASNLDGGLLEWYDAGRALVSDDSSHPPHVV